MSSMNKSMSGVARGEELSVYNAIDVEFPEKKFEQDEEFCVISMDGVQKRIRFHDYNELYSIPGLYEKVFYEHLKCCSPEVVCNLFKEQLLEHRYDPSQLRVFELGAGNGMVGERLRNIGASLVVGNDILIEAKIAAFRDRPEVYDEYYAMDLTDIPEEIHQSLREFRFNCMVSVAALGFDDLPPLAYINAYNLVSDGGWIAFNIKDAFLTEEDTTGFSALMRRMIKEKYFSIHSQVKYQHRLATDHSPLNYIAIVGKKLADIPPSVIGEFAV